jgi:hypothetical protein
MVDFEEQPRRGSQSSDAGDPNPRWVRVSYGCAERAERCHGVGVSWRRCKQSISRRCVNAGATPSAKPKKELGFRAVACGGSGEPRGSGD